MFENHPHAGGEAVHVFQLLNAGNDVIFDSFGEGQVMRREDQVHGRSMQPERGKIQRKCVET